MSLIPSESLNFPDHFRATVKPASPKEKTSLPTPTQPNPLPPPPVAIEPAKIPVALEPPKISAPVESHEIPVPVQSPKIPVPVEPPHRIPVVPRAKVRFSKQEPIDGPYRADAGRRDPQRSLRDGQGQKIATSTVAKPVEAATLSITSPAASEVEPSAVSRFSTERPSTSSRRLHATARRRNKLFRFFVCEAVAIGILLPLVMLGISGRLTDQTLILLIRILIVSAVATVVIFPMIFFRRWENSRARER